MPCNILFSDAPSRVKTSLGTAYLLCANASEEMCLENVFEIGQIFTWNKINYPITWKHLNVDENIYDTIVDTTSPFFGSPKYEITSAYYGVVSYLFPCLFLQANKIIYVIPLESCYALSQNIDSHNRVDMTAAVDKTTTSTVDTTVTNNSLFQHSYVIKEHLLFTQRFSKWCQNNNYTNDSNIQHNIYCHVQTYNDFLSLLSICHLCRFNFLDVIFITSFSSIAPLTQKNYTLSSTYLSTAEIATTICSPEFFLKLDKENPSNTVIKDTGIAHSSDVNIDNSNATTSIHSTDCLSSYTLPQSFIDHIVVNSNEFQDILAPSFSMQKLRDHWSVRDPVFRYLTTDVEATKGVRILDQSFQIIECIWAFICSQNNNTTRIAANMQQICSLYGKLQGILCAHKTSNGDNDNDHFILVWDNTLTRSSSQIQEILKNGQKQKEKKKNQIQQSDELNMVLPIWSFPFLYEFPDVDTLTNDLNVIVKAGYRTPHFVAFFEHLKNLIATGYDDKCIPITPEIVKNIEHQLINDLNNTNNKSSIAEDKNDNAKLQTISLLQPESFLYVSLPFTKREKTSFGVQIHKEFSIQNSHDLIETTFTSHMNSSINNTNDDNDINNILKWQLLQTFPGIGPKVASCIALFSLQNNANIPMDTHILRLFSHYYIPYLLPKLIQFHYWYHMYFDSSSSPSNDDLRPNNNKKRSIQSTNIDCNTKRSRKLSSFEDHNITNKDATVKVSELQNNTGTINCEILYVKQLYKLQLQLFKNVLTLVPDLFIIIYDKLIHLATVAHKDTSNSLKNNTKSCDIEQVENGSINSLFDQLFKLQSLPLQTVHDTSYHLMSEYITNLNNSQKKEVDSDEKIAQKGKKKNSENFPQLTSSAELSTAFSTFLISVLGDCAGLAHSVMFSALLRHKSQDKCPHFHWFQVLQHMEQEKE